MHVRKGLETPSGCLRLDPGSALESYFHRVLIRRHVDEAVYGIDDGLRWGVHMRLQLKFLDARRLTPSLQRAGHCCCLVDNGRVQ